MVSLNVRRVYRFTAISYRHPQSCINKIVIINIKVRSRLFLLVKAYLVKNIDYTSRYILYQDTFVVAVLYGVGDD